MGVPILHGDMQGIIGGQIPAIPALELEDETTKQLPNGSDAEPQSEND
jgi:hypothetical protein